MGKAILMSIQPKWVAKILNGKKTIEVRKKFPKDYVGWVYIYCTKNQGKYGETQLLYNFKTEEYFIGKDLDNHNPNDICYLNQNGKVVAKFWCDKVEEIYCQLHFNGFALETDTMSRDTLNKKSCLTDKELREYFNRGVYTFDETYGYAIYISKVEVFDKPKVLKDFYKVGAWKVFEEQFDSSYLKREQQEIMEELEQTITKAPQSWCYVEGE